MLRPDVVHNYAFKRTPGRGHYASDTLFARCRLTRRWRPLFGIREIFAFLGQIHHLAGEPYSATAYGSKSSSHSLTNCRRTCSSGPHPHSAGNTLPNRQYGVRRKIQRIATASGVFPLAQHRPFASQSRPLTPAPQVHPHHPALDHARSTRVCSAPSVPAQVPFEWTPTMR